jgi:hypothetical protein
MGAHFRCRTQTLIFFVWTLLKDNMDVVRSSARNVAINRFSRTNVRVMGLLNERDKADISSFAKLLHNRAIGELLGNIGAFRLKLDQLIVSDHLHSLSGSTKVIFCSAFGLLGGVGAAASDAAVIIRWWIPHPFKRQGTRRSKRAAFRLRYRTARLCFPISVGSNSEAEANDD